MSQRLDVVNVSSTCFKALWWDLLAPAGRRAHCKQRALFVPIRCFCKVKMPVIGKWEHSGRWCSWNLISFETHWCVFSALLGASRYQEMSHCGPRNFSNHANWAARSRWAAAWKLWLSAVRSLVVAHQIKKKAQGARLALVPGSDAEPRHRQRRQRLQGASGINQMLSFEKCVWNKVDAFQEVLEGIIQALEALF